MGDQPGVGVDLVHCLLLEQGLCFVLYQLMLCSDMGMSGTKDERITWYSTQPHLRNGRDVVSKILGITINTDAGWGVCNSLCTGWLWSPEERMLHINHLELLAGFFAMQFFTNDQRNIHVHLRSARCC